DGVGEAGREGIEVPFNSALRGKRVMCRVLPPAWLERLILLATAPARIDGLRVPTGLEERVEAVVGGACDEDIGRGGLARDEAALRLIAQNRNELGAIVGLFAQRLIRDDDRGPRYRGRRDAIEHLL